MPGCVAKIRRPAAGPGSGAGAAWRLASRCRTAWSRSPVDREGAGWQHLGAASAADLRQERHDVAPADGEQPPVVDRACARGCAAGARSSRAAPPARSRTAHGTRERRANSRGARCAPTRAGSSRLEVAEVRERLGRRPFLAHEEHRRRGASSTRAVAARKRLHRVRSCASRSPQCAIADLIVVLQEVDEGGRRQMCAGLAARAPAASASARPGKQSPRPDPGTAAPGLSA